MNNDTLSQKPSIHAQQVIDYYNIQDFPINIEDIILDYTNQNFDDPITKFIKNDYEGFDGALCPSKDNNKRWCIIYNNKVKSKGRMNFTIAHEFGHYLMHRNEEPEGIICNEKDGVYISKKYKLREKEADNFAKCFLIPQKPFGQMIKNNEVDLQFLRNCAEFFNVSLTAVCLRWLELTKISAVLIASRKNKVIWSSNSNMAKNNGIFYFAGRDIPRNSLTYRAMQNSNDFKNEKKELSKNIWKTNQQVMEYVINTVNYDFTLTLLIFSKSNKSNLTGIGLGADLSEILFKNGIKNIGDLKGMSLMNISKIKGINDNDFIKLRKIVNSN